MTYEHFEVWLNGEMAAIFTDRLAAEKSALLHHQQMPRDEISVKNERGAYVWLPDWRAE